MQLATEIGSPTWMNSLRPNERVVIEADFVAEYMRQVSAF
jgi:hypothetical protein